jgi:hypothetical protein
MPDIFFLGQILLRFRTMLIELITLSGSEMRSSSSNLVAILVFFRLSTVLAIRARSK